MPQINLATATLVIQYKDPETSPDKRKSVIKAELDGEVPLVGQPAYYKVYANCSYTQHRSSGNISGSGSGIDQKEDFLTFAGYGANTASLSYPYSGNASFTWYGTIYGRTINSAGEVTLTGVGENQLVVTACKVTYNSRFNRFSIQTSAPLVVVFIIERRA